MTCQRRLLHHFDVLESFQKLRHRQLGEQGGATLNELMWQVEVLMEQVIAVGNFRHRVEEYAEISVLAPSMLLAAQAISHHTQALAERLVGKKATWDLSILEAAIEDIAKACEDDVGLTLELEDEIVFEPYGSEGSENETVAVSLTLQTTMALCAYTNALRYMLATFKTLHQSLETFKEVL